MVRSLFDATSFADAATSALSFAVLAGSMSCTTSGTSAFARLRAIGPPMAPSPMNPTLPAIRFSLHTTSDIDRQTRNEIGVRRGEEADHVGLVGRLGDAAQRRALDLLGL